jgi:hypothetical protein
MQLRDPSQVRRLLGQAVAERRAAWLVFGIATLLLTPFLVGLALLLLGLCLVFSLRSVLGLHADVARTLVVGVDVICGLCLVLCARQGVARRDGPPVLGRLLAGAALFAGLLLISLPASAGARLRAGQPGAVVVFLGLAVGLLGLLGSIYQPPEVRRSREDGGSFDLWGILRLRQGMSNALLGIVTGVPELLLSAYGEVLRDLWLLRGLSAAEEAAAVQALRALGDGERRAAESAMVPPPGRRARRALLRLELMREGAAGPSLTEAGKALVGEVVAPEYYDPPGL